MSDVLSPEIKALDPREGRRLGLETGSPAVSRHKERRYFPNWKARVATSRCRSRRGRCLGVPIASPWVIAGSSSRVTETVPSPRSYKRQKTSQRRGICAGVDGELRCGSEFLWRGISLVQGDPGRVLGNGASRERVRPVCGLSHRLSGARRPRLQATK